MMRDATLVKWCRSDLSVAFVNVRASSDLLNASGGDGDGDGDGEGSFGAPGRYALGDAAT